MDDEQWQAERNVQNDDLVKQIRALSSLPRRTRLKYQLLLVRCRSCGDVVLEVLDTLPYPVVRTRRTELRHYPQPQAAASADDVSEHWKDFFASRSQEIRLQPDWNFTPISADAQAEEPRRFIIACRCRGDRQLSTQWVREKIRQHQVVVVI